MIALEIIYRTSTLLLSQLKINRHSYLVHQDKELLVNYIWDLQEDHKQHMAKQRFIIMYLIMQGLVNSTQMQLNIQIIRLKEINDMVKMKANKAIQETIRH